MKRVAHDPRLVVLNWRDRQHPSAGGAAPYQEKVLGWMQYPTGGRWTSVGVAYPRLADIGTTGSPNTLPDPTCATPTSCATTRSTHVSSCFQTTSDAGNGGGGGATGGGAGGGGGGADGVGAGAHVVHAHAPRALGGGEGGDGGEEEGFCVHLSRGLEVWRLSWTLTRFAGIFAFRSSGRVVGESLLLLVLMMSR